MHTHKLFVRVPRLFGSKIIKVSGITALFVLSVFLFVHSAAAVVVDQCPDGTTGTPPDCIQILPQCPPGAPLPFPICFPPTQPGFVSGEKFNDLNGNGVRDNGEPGLANWTIRLGHVTGPAAEDGHIPIEIVALSLTGEDGKFTLPVIQSGEYKLFEEHRDNWQPKNPPSVDSFFDITYRIDLPPSPPPPTGGFETSSFFDVFVDLSLSSTTQADVHQHALQFGNEEKLGSIEATKFEDINSNHERDQGEPGLEGWKICLDGENCKVTDANGRAVWNNLPPREYTVSEEERSGWSPTTKGGIEQSVTVRAFATSSVLFGNHRQTLHVVKYWDKNGNGQRDNYWTGEWQWDSESGDNGEWVKVYAQEPALSGWEMCLSHILNFNEGQPVIDSKSKQCKTTDMNGEVSWPGLASSEYQLTETPQDGWTKTQPEDDSYHVEFGGSDQIFSFGNTRNVIKVIKFWDKNKNGKRDGEFKNVWNNNQWVATSTLEPALKDWEFCLFKLVSKGDEDEDAPVEDPRGCKTTKENGIASWDGVDSGEYVVRETTSTNPTWSPTSPKNGGQSFELGRGEKIFPFGNNTSVIHALKYFDWNQNGRRDVIETQHFFGPEWGLPNWSICLYHVTGFDEEDQPLVDQESKQCKNTDASGTVEWLGQAPGEYKLQEESRAGWNNTQPDEIPWYTFELDQGGNVSYDFGNWTRDTRAPESIFDDPMNHKVFDTEMTSLNVSGSSVDTPLMNGDEGGSIETASGVREANLVITKIAGEETLNSFPSHSFFDVFTELSCDHHEPIQTEMIALDLISGGIASTTWNHDWVPHGPGIYCFEVHATDNAGNVEHTAHAGPIAYILTPKISAEGISHNQQTSFTVNWTTDHPATSRVIYDTASHAILGSVPNYGYAFSTPETNADPKVTEHSVTISGLGAGTTYYFRTISHGSPVAVGGEHSNSTAPPPPPGDGGGGGGGGGGGISIQPIVITAQSPLSAVIGSTVTEHVTITDLNGFTPIVGAMVPPGGTFSTSTNDLTWSPTAAGKASVTITASDPWTSNSKTIILEATSSSSQGGGGLVLGASTTTLPSPASGTQCGEYITQYLWYGGKNDPDQVKKLQAFMNDHEGAHLAVTGFYGKLTRAAARAFHLKHKDVIPKATGNIFKLTKGLINGIKCSLAQGASGQVLGASTQNGSHKFNVEIDGVTIGGVHTISGLEHESDIVEYKDGEDGTMHTRPGNHKPGKISITKDWSNTNEWYKWRKTVVDGKAKNKSVSVIFHNDAGEEAGRMNFYVCYPTRWQGPKFDGASIAHALEKITLSCDHTTVTGNVNVRGEFGSGVVGNLDGNNASGSFAYRSANQVSSTTGLVSDGVSQCASNIPAGEVNDCMPNVY